MAVWRFMTSATLTMLLVGCTQTAVQQPTALPAQTPTLASTSVVSPSKIPATASAGATPKPRPTEPPEVTAEPGTATAIEPPAVQGTTVLTIPGGSSDGQVGLLQGPSSFRIGADNSFRVLDSTNDRILFFEPDGTFRNAFALPDLEIAKDFIVTTTGEVYAFGQLQDYSYAVIRYTADGTLAETIPVNAGVGYFANGISLSAEQENKLGQELALTGGIRSYWTIRHFGEIVPAGVQMVTKQNGTVSPRSPTPLGSVTGADMRPTLTYTILTGSVTSNSLDTVRFATVDLPDTQFFNIDRAMNPYFVRLSEINDQATIDVWRTQEGSTENGPTLSVVGGARISIPEGCGLSLQQHSYPEWRRFYIDQTGSAWLMCTGESTTTITRYELLDAQGNLLPPAGDIPENRPIWSPGSRFSAA